MQHYTFAVKAFVEMVKQFGMDEYEFAVHETKTYEVIEDVRNFKSEIGILYLNDFNRKVLTKLFAESNLEFRPIQDCGIYVYLWRDHPLAKKKEIALEELEEYPCLSFDQGTNNSFYFAEEVLSTYQYKRLVRANDRDRNRSRPGKSQQLRLWYLYEKRAPHQRTPGNPVGYVALLCGLSF